MEDNLYELPLLPGNVDSFKGRLRMAALVDRGHWHQADPEGLSHFYRNLPPDEPLLKPAAQLVQVAHFRGDNDNDQDGYLFCIVGSTRAKTGVMLHYLLRLGRLPKMLYLGRAVEKYVVLGPTDPGETKGLILRLGGTWGLESSILVQGDLVVKNSSKSGGEQVFTLPPVPFDPEAAAAAATNTRGHHRFEMATDDGQTAFFSMTLSREGLRLKATTNASLAANAGSQPKERNVKTTKRFGFLAGAYAHIWDMKAKTVEVVELAAARAGRTYPVLYVPMDVYFACNEAEWARERVTSAPLDFDAPAPTANDDDDDDDDLVKSTPSFLLSPQNMMIMGGILGGFVLLSCTSWMVISRCQKSRRGGGGGGRGRGDGGRFKRGDDFNGGHHGRRSPWAPGRGPGGGRVMFHTDATIPSDTSDDSGLNSDRREKGGGYRVSPRRGRPPPPPPPPPRRIRR